METKQERLKGLMAQMLSFVPAGPLHSVPLVVVAKTLQVKVEDVYKVHRYDAWPYTRIDVDGMTVGVLEPSEEGRDILGISWPDARNPSGKESRSLFIPPVPLDPVQYETYLQLRQDGVAVDRAAELAVTLHEAAR